MYEVQYKHTIQYNYRCHNHINKAYIIYLYIPLLQGVCGGIGLFIICVMYDDLATKP